MNIISFFVLATLLYFGGAQAGETHASTCRIKKLPGTKTQASGGWNVSILKESQRTKPGDSFLALEKNSGKRCEVELPSWAQTLYSTTGLRAIFIVEQSDASNTVVSWVDPADCKLLKTLQEFGPVKINNSAVEFAGGKDGPDKVPGKRIPLNADCLP